MTSVSFLMQVGVSTTGSWDNFLTKRFSYKVGVFGKISAVVFVKTSADVFPKMPT